MKSFGFTLLVLLVIIGLCVGGYFSYKTMTKPATYLPIKTQTVGDLHPIASEPDTGTTSSAGANAVATLNANPAAPAVNASSAITTSDNATLIANLNTLIKNKTTLKVGSKGASVGYVEQFVNLYFKKTSKIDNVFGKGLAANTSTFQKQNKLSVTGVVNTSTLQMMVKWLQKN